MTRRLSSFLLVAVLGAAISCGDDDSADDDTSKDPATGDGVCGDGTVDEGEQCDDGDKMSGDGCSSACKKEGDAGSGAGKGDAGAIDAGSRGGTIDAGHLDSGGGTKPGNGAQPDASKGDNQSDAGSGGNKDSGTAPSMDSGTASSEDSGSTPATADLCTGDPADECETCSCGMCEMEFKACREVEGAAAEGPGVGKTKKELCQAVVRCGQKAGCRGTDCFCGDPSLLAQCITDTPTGPCKDEIFAAAETTDPQTVVGRQTDQDFALAFASAVSTCSTNSCADACGQ